MFFRSLQNCVISKFSLSLRLLPLCMLVALAIAGGHVYSPAKVDASTPATCDHLNVTLSDDKNYYIFQAGASAGSTTITGYSFDFGDGQSYDFNFGSTSGQDRQNTTVRHTYSKNGDYTAKVQVATDTGTKHAKVSSAACQASVAIGEQAQAAASELPNTGAHAPLGILLGISATTAVAYEFYLRNRTHK